MIMKNSRGHISEEDILDFERKYNINLPESYRSFLLQNNGGTPNPNIFDFNDNYGQNTSSLVHYFYALYNGDGYDNIEQNYKLFKSEGRIPINILPIADDPFGNMVCISFSGSDCGKIYFWDHELESQNKSYDNLSLIADSFTDFINSLRKEN